MTGMHAAPPALVHLDSPFINFRDFKFSDASAHGYRWIDLKRFRLAAAAPEDRALLAALIAHPQFRDTYDGNGALDRPRHGQWRLDRITPDAYRPVSAATASALIRAWTVQHGPVPQALVQRIQQQVHTPIATATSTYVLAPLPEDARHEYGPIHIDFHELILIDRPAKILTLVVAADD
ncbi:hypothetical protein GA0115233_108525 [Streptomyces sp. DI166]|uniref:hypothetical protein n=1 Tax=unclassified Streptomyces TaxID=2593676 RepID=UPI0007F34D7B|nr:MULTISPECIES: hypothetical protein [unclassified Streptomyces]SBT94335.1 hypothetical protein GA0115233_108525 [Streptomyces sp. DI166]